MFVCRLKIFLRGQNALLCHLKSNLTSINSYGKKINTLTVIRKMKKNEIPL